MIELSEHDRGWLEGVIDSEGCIRLAKLRYITFKSRYPRAYTWNPVVTINNTDIEFLNRIKDIVASGSIHVHMNYPNKNYKKSWLYTFTRATCRAILPQLRLIVKEKQRTLVIEALALVNAHRSTLHRMPDATDKRLGEIWLEMKHLNMRGKGRLPTKDDEQDLAELGVEYHV